MSEMLYRSKAWLLSLYKCHPVASESREEHPHDADVAANKYGYSSTPVHEFFDLHKDTTDDLFHVAFFYFFVSGFKPGG